MGTRIGSPSRGSAAKFLEQTTCRNTEDLKSQHILCNKMLRSILRQSPKGLLATLPCHDARSAAATSTKVPPKCTEPACPHAAAAQGIGPASNKQNPSASSVELGWQTRPHCPSLFLVISDHYRYQGVWRFAIGRLAHLQFG